MAGRGVGKVLAVGAAVVLALAACHVPNKDVYREGYNAGIQSMHLGAPNADEVVHDCSLTADGMTQKFGWDADTRLDFMLGCQDSAHGRKSEYP